MAGDLFSLPIRFGFRAARAAARTSVQVSERATALASSAVRTVRRSGGKDEPDPSMPSEARQRSSQPGSHPPGRNGSGPGDDAEASREVTEPETAEAEAEAGETETAAAEEGQGESPERPGTDPRSQAEPADLPPTEAPAPAPEAPAPQAAGADLAEPVHVSEGADLVDSVADPGAEDGAGAQVTVDEPWEGYGQLNAPDVISRLNEASDAQLATVELYERVNRNRSTVLTAVERALKSRSGS